MPDYATQEELLAAGNGLSAEAAELLRSYWTANREVDHASTLFVLEDGLSDEDEELEEAGFVSQFPGKPLLMLTVEGRSVATMMFG